MSNIRHLVRGNLLYIPLKLTKEIGSQIMATFWGCFAAVRFASIFTSIFVKPIYVLTASCLLSSIGSILLAIFGNKSIILLWTSSAMIGLGLASTYASGFLYLKSYLKITNRIGTQLIYFVYFQSLALFLLSDSRKNHKNLSKIMERFFQNNFILPGQPQGGEKLKATVY